MSGITNEQKLYVLLNGTCSKTEEEKAVWGVVRKWCSKDASWFADVADNLVKNGYVSHSFGTISGNVWTATDEGRKQIPILWRGSMLRRLYADEQEKETEKSKFKNRHSNIAEIIKLILAACFGALADRIVEHLF